MNKYWGALSTSRILVCFLRPRIASLLIRDLRFSLGL